MDEMQEFIMENELEDYDFKDSILGISTEGNVIYGYDELVDHFIKTQPTWNRTDSVEWVEYNLLRSIPYEPDPKPVVIFKSPLWSDNSEEDTHVRKDTSET